MVIHSLPIIGPLLSLVTVFFKVLPCLMDCNNWSLAWPGFPFFPPPPNAGRPIGGGNGGPEDGAGGGGGGGNGMSVAIQLNRLKAHSNDGVVVNETIWRLDIHLLCESLATKGRGVGDKWVWCDTKNNIGPVNVRKMTHEMRGPCTQASTTEKQKPRRRWRNPISQFGTFSSLVAGNVITTCVFVGHSYIRTNGCCYYQRVPCALSSFINYLKKKNLL